jgi:hypothetical protein
MRVVHPKTADPNTSQCSDDRLPLRERNVAAEAASLMEKAFAEGCVDLGILADWEDGS